jgi:lactate permease
VLTLSPILVILILMLGFRWSAARAGLVGMTVAFAVAVAAYAFPVHVHPQLTLTEATGGVLAEAGFTALTILWIIGPALGIHQLQMRTGSAEILRSALGALAPDPRILALLVAWFFVLFMEGAAGFGASVALAAPFLVAAGFGAVQAVTITLIGHVVGVSFGAIGTPIVPQVAATGLSGEVLALATGPYHSILGWIPLVVMVWIVSRDKKGPGGIWGWTALAAACYLIPYTLLWWLVGPELPTVGGALFGGVLFIILMRWFGRSDAAVAGERVSGRRVALAAAPYLVLVGLVMVTRLVPFLREPLRGVRIGWEWLGAFSGGMEPLYHPGTMLLAGFAVGAILQRAPGRDVREAFLGATRQLIPVAVALVSMLVLSRIMVHAGMTQALAEAAADGAGGAWPFLAPFVGVLGTFVTGSATASNILFTDFQQEMAMMLGLSTAALAGVQTFGAAVGNMICPHNVVAAGATVGLQGREGEILRRTLGVTLVYAALGGLLALLWLV